MEQQGYKKTPGPMQQPFSGREHDLPAVDQADWRRELRDTILRRVMPRLSEVSREAEAALAAGPAAAVQVAAFSDLVLTAAVPGLIRHIDGLRAQGMSIDVLMLQLLASTARRLGDLWLEDKVSFLDVTAGLSRLQGVVRALGPDIEGPVPRQVRGRNILLAAVAGEQHVFGLSMVAAFFRREGWDVTLEPRIAFADLLSAVEVERYAVIGLSVANDRLLSGLPGQVEALRRASLNREVALLAGGPAFLLDPGLHERVGVDAVARDAPEAVRAAEALFSRTTAARAV